MIYLISYNFQRAYVKTNKKAIAVCFVSQREFNIAQAQSKKEKNHFAFEFC